MVKISLTGGFAKLSLNKCKKLVLIGDWLNTNNKLKEEDQSLKEMMNCAKEFIVMERFLSRVESSERIWN